MSLSDTSYIPIPGSDKKITITHVVCNYFLEFMDNESNFLDLKRLIYYGEITNLIFVESKRRKSGKESSNISVALTCPHMDLSSSTANINHRGKITHSAGKDKMRTIIAARLLEMTFIRKLKIRVKAKDFRLTNYICNIFVGKSIDLKQVKKKFGSSAVKDSKYPGVIVTSLKFPNVKITIYLSGRMNLVGARTKNDVVDEFTRVLLVINSFLIKEVKNTSIYHKESIKKRKRDKMGSFVSHLNNPGSNKRLAIEAAPLSNAINLLTFK